LVCDKFQRMAESAALTIDLVVSLKTVRNHASTISNKLHVADCAQAMDVAQRKGLG
jgi:DNA-binding NarL/FixJ family response regulator